ncbi:MAG TPA: glycosyl hydrolase family 18 protein [Chitinophagaceae bacterium]
MKKGWLIIFVFFYVQVTAQSNYKVIAYYTGNGETIRQYPIDKLTHIIYSFLKLQNDTLGFRNDDQRRSLEQLVALKKTYPHLKIMVSIGGWGGCAPCSDLFASVEHRNVFAKTTVALFRQYDIDGLDLDWEYPAIEGYPGHKWDKADKNNFTELVRALRNEMKNEFLLTFAAGGFIKYLEESVDWDAVMPLVDFVNLMTYDLVNGYSKVTGHHTLLYHQEPEQESTQKCVEWLINKKVEPAKLIIGAAFYARVWENVEPNNNGLYQPGKFLRSVQYKDFSSYFADSSGFRHYWDKKAKAPYRYSVSKKLFGTFDDKHSLEAKTKFIKKKKLGGIMFWELSEDEPKDGLVEKIHQGLN